MTRDKLKYIQQVLREHPEQTFAYWYGHMKDTDVYSLLSKTYLVCAGCYDGTVKAFRFIGALSDTGKHGKIVYRGNLLRITNGPRGGIIITQDQLKDDENASPIGLVKIMEENPKSPRYLNIKRVGDKNFIGSLYEHLKGNNSGDELQLPEFYIATDNSADLAVRISTGIRDMFEQLAGYDETLSMQDNFTKLAPVLGKDTGGKRGAYPYMLCTGRGLILTDPPVMSGHVLLKQGHLDINKEHVSIELEKYIRKI